MITCRTVAVEAFPTRSQTTFGGGPWRNASWRKSESFETIPRSWSPAYSQISWSVAVVEPDRRDVLALGKQIAQLTHEVPGEVLVEQELHAVASRRSRSAANSIAARTSSGVSSGKSATISSVVIPEARYSRTS